MTLGASLWRELIDGLTPADVAAVDADDWRGWLDAVVPGYLWPPYASYHAEFWDWAWGIERERAHASFVAIWPRGFNKSTSVEAALAMLAARRRRRYALYVSATQEQADTHVANIAGILEARAFADHFPETSQRKIGKYGNSQGWRRNRLRTADGFTVDAIGLDTAARGAKVDEDRPDLLIFDDIDEVLDSPATVRKKITTMTKSLLPARAPHAVALVAQNLVHSDGIVSRLADGRADFLADRIVSGPHPALRNAAYEQESEAGTWTIVAGEPTWAAMGIPDLQRVLNEIGLSAFRGELQHETDLIEGGIFGHLIYRHCRWDAVPPLNRIVVWVDPAVTDTDTSDAHGIQADGLADTGEIYRLYSWESRTSPEDSLRRAILKAIELGAECVGVETDQGGDTWESVYRRVVEDLIETGVIAPGTVVPDYRHAKAGGRGPKSHRANQMLADYERGEIIHVVYPGTDIHEVLEKALKRYLKRKPYDLVDAGYYAWADLRGLIEAASEQSVLVVGGSSGWGYRRE